MSTLSSRRTARVIQTLLINSLSVAALFVFAVLAADAGDGIRTERVQFKKGASSTVIEAKITGYEGVDYVLNAKKGQYMNVSMVTNNGANYFNIIAPGETDVAIFSSSIGENQFEGTLPASGDYKIRVYLMRSAARRNETAKYRLEMVISGAADATSGTKAAPSGSDAMVAGTNYHATGSIPCAMAKGQPTSSCPFGVVRKGNGSGMVTVTKPDGSTRTIYFETGKATGYDMSQADPAEFSMRQEGDLNIISIGDERYEIPDAVISGG